MFGVTLAFAGLCAAAAGAVLFICRRELAAHIKAWRGGYEINFDALGAELNEGVQDMNFRGQP